MININSYLLDYLGETNNAKVQSYIPTFVELGIAAINAELRSAFLEVTITGTTLPSDFAAMRFVSVNGIRYTYSDSGEDYTFNIVANVLTLAPEVAIDDVVKFTYYAINQTVLETYSPQLLLHAAAVEAYLYIGDNESAELEKGIFTAQIGACKGWDSHGSLSLGGGWGVAGDPQQEATGGSGGGSVAVPGAGMVKSNGTVLQTAQGNVDYLTAASPVITGALTLGDEILAAGLPGNAGQVLTSNGISTTPTWQNSPGGATVPAAGMVLSDGVQLGVAAPNTHYLPPSAPIITSGMSLTGQFALSSSPGNAGQILKSLGIGATPVWGDETGVQDGDKGDVTVTNAGATWTLSPIVFQTDRTWTGSQRASVVTDNDGSFDMNAGQNFKCTPAAAIQLAFTNLAAGQSGFITLINGSNYAITKAAAVKCPDDMLATISATGTYLLSYLSDGTSVFVVASGALA